MNKFELDHVESRLRLYGIKLVYKSSTSKSDFDKLLETELVEELIDKGLISDDEEYEECTCESISELIDFCIDNKCSYIFCRPIMFSIDDCRESINLNFGEFLLRDYFDKEIVRLKKRFNNVNEEELSDIYDDELSHYLNYIEDRLSAISDSTTLIMGHMFEAYSLNKCMSYYGDVFKDGNYSPKQFVDIFEEAVNVMESRMERLVYNSNSVNNNSL